jgi:tRNA-modifying protein YgfZ
VSFLDPNARDIVVVQGPDALSYLQSQIAQEIRDQAVGEHRWTLVLDPTGKVVVLAGVTRRAEERFEFDVDAGFGEVLAARLNRFKIRVRADVGVEPAATSEPADAVEAARVAAGWPRMGAEIVSGETIPAVTGVTSVAVNFTKGCYPGQELVERMDSRGADAPKSVRVVDVADTAVVGDPILAADGTEVGTITSVSPAGGEAIALVKRGHDIGRPPAHLHPDD